MTSCTPVCVFGLRISSWCLLGVSELLYHAVQALGHVVCCENRVSVVVFSSTIGNQRQLASTGCKGFLSNHTTPRNFCK
ncbi:hypothetical protein J3F83DRAFT_727132 [Trichoderma novae-zelandiae]